MKPQTVQQVADIVLAEFEYWQNSPDDIREVAIGGVGAAANIFAAILGHPAAWHPKAPGSATMGPAPVDIGACGLQLVDYLAGQVIIGEFASTSTLEAADATARGAAKMNHSIEQHLAFNAYQVAEAMVAEKLRREGLAKPSPSPEVINLEAVGVCRALVEDREAAGIDLSDHDDPLAKIVRDAQAVIQRVDAAEAAGGEA